jgi:hypothetical protein
MTDREIAQEAYDNRMITEQEYVHLMKAVDFINENNYD